MKKYFVVAVALMMLCHAASAEKMYYKKGQNLVQAGIGIGGIGGFYGNSSLPVLSVGVDLGIHEFISVGGLVGYSTSRFEYPYFFVGQNGTYSYKYSYITIAARGSYHPPLDVKNTDLYGGLDLGYTIVSANVDGQTPAGFGIVGASGSYLFFGVHVGARYFFSPRFAAYGELGYGFGILNLGINFRI